MEAKLGRQVCGGELYAAHFLGADAACKLIRGTDATPNASAAQLFPDAASANASVFFHADGSAKSVREVYDWAMRSRAARRLSPTVQPRRQRASPKPPTWPALPWTPISKRCWPA